MNPLGIALVFVVFWLVIGLGLFLFFYNLASLRRHSCSAVLARVVAVEPLRHNIETAVSVALLLIGVGMVYAGAYATYIVIYR